MYESAGRDNRDSDSKLAVFMIENVKLYKIKARIYGLVFLKKERESFVAVFVVFLAVVVVVVSGLVRLKDQSLK